MKDLVRIAILGTAQAPGALRSGTAVDDWVEELQKAGAADGRELALLLCAGGAAVVRRAGTRAKRWTSPLAASDSETLRRASPGLSGLLAGLLQGESHDLLAEALESMARANLRLPEELLPLALDEADPELRARLLPVLGRRGRWLAEQRSTWAGDANEGAPWAWATTESSPSATSALPMKAEEAWDTGTHEEREQLLTVARRADRARAHEWLAATFKVDRAEQRKRWIEIMESDLQPDDAPFLEVTLTDRSAAVRSAAARALWRIPESSIARAVRERLESLLPAGDSLDVQLPPEPFDRSLERLGISEIPPEGVGRRQWWLAQLVSAIPPAYFCERHRCPPATLLSRVEPHDSAPAVLDGWTSATLRFDDAGWLVPLWDVWNRVQAPRGWVETEPLLRLTERLVSSEHRAELEPRLIRAVDSNHNAELVDALPRPWPRALARAVVAAIQRRADWFSRVWVAAATSMPIDEVPATLATSPVLGRKLPFDDALTKFLSVLDLRRRLEREIAAHGPATPPTDPAPTQETG